MISRIFAFLMLLWVIGFAYFCLLLPLPAEAQKADAIVVLTGASGRIDHALERLEAGDAPRLLISGVGKHVQPEELAARYGRSPDLFACCITLGFQATDTRSNAQEVAAWIAKHNYKNIRLITTDWHMRRARLELHRVVADDVVILPDAVRSQPEFSELFREYHKYLVGLVSVLVGI